MFRLSLKGTKLIAGGNAPGKSVRRSDPEGVVRSHTKLKNVRDIVRRNCDPFRVGT